jgi:O-acetylserine/cysteine efflux transporter|tara:strand:- start:1109 stop:1969 length:861 start_codon:yes stop_codon:yes gene_type:complete
LTLRDSLIAAIVPIFLGFGFVIAKPAMEYLPPFLLMGLRFTFVALLLVWWFPIPKGYLKRIFFASLIANTTQYSITYTGLSFIDASAAVLLVQTEVPFGVLFAYFMLKEKPTIKALIGIAIAFVGVYILTGSPNLDGKFLGVSLTIIGSAVWALGQVLVKPLSKEIHPLALVAWLGLFSGPILITLSSIFDGNTINYFKNASFEAWMIAIYLGFIMQPITYGCFYYVLKNNPLYKVLPIVTMGIPPTGLLAAIFLLGEEPTKELFIGGAIIIVGVILIVFTKPNKK